MVEYFNLGPTDLKRQCLWVHLNQLMNQYNMQAYTNPYTGKHPMAT